MAVARYYWGTRSEPPSVERPAVFREGVHAEVGGQVADDRVGVIGVALGVVVLHEQPLILEPVVDRSPVGGGLSGVGEMQVREAAAGAVAR
jgi:hypothetical protein